MVKAEQDVVLFCTPALSHPFEVAIGAGIRNELRNYDFELIILSTGFLPSHVSEHSDYFSFHHLVRKMGISKSILHLDTLLYGSRHDFAPLILKHYPSCETVNIGSPIEGYCAVGIDNSLAMRQIAYHLDSIGATNKIVIVNGPESNVEAEERRQSLLEALKELKVEPESISELKGDFTISRSFEAVKEYLNSHTPLPDVFICCNDLAAKGTISALENAGYSVPEDTFVTGFDGFEFAAQMSVPLTTIVQPARQIGQAATQTLLSGPHPKKSKTIETQLEIGESTGCKKARTSDSEDEHISEAVWSRAKFKDLEDHRININRAFFQSTAPFETLKEVSSRLPSIGVQALMLFTVEDQAHPVSTVLKQQVIHGAHEVLPSAVSYLNFFHSDFFASLSKQVNGHWVMAPIFVNHSFHAFLLCNMQPDLVDYIDLLALLFTDSFTNAEEKQLSEQLNERILEVEKMAALGSLVSGVAHEVNTPIGVSKLAASHLNSELQLLMQAQESGKLTKSKFEQFLELCGESSSIIESSLDRAAELISKFKQVAVDQSIEETREVDIGQYIIDVMSSLRLKAKHTEVKVETNIEKGVMVSTDPGVWAQILSNLFLNAIIHAFDNGTRKGHISISLHRIDNVVELNVSDDGKGMPEHVAECAFDPFVTTRRDEGGSGLGLHIVHTLVTNRLGGKVEVDSNQDHGTEFTIKIPL